MQLANLLSFLFSILAINESVSQFYYRHNLILHDINFAPFLLDLFSASRFLIVSFIFSLCLLFFPLIYPWTFLVLFLSSFFLFCILSFTYFLWQFSFFLVDLFFSSFLSFSFLHFLPFFIHSFPTFSFFFSFFTSFLCFFLPCQWFCFL